MNTIIICESTHHGNTKKLVEAICEKFNVESVSIENADDVEFSQYDTVGIASGVAYSKFYKATESFAKEKLPDGKNVFFLFTCGSYSDRYTNQISDTVKAKGCQILGVYGCLGFDTFGPFKLIGGVAKGHPTEEEIAGSVRFYEKTVADVSNNG